MGKLKKILLLLCVFSSIMFFSWIQQWWASNLNNTLSVEYTKILDEFLWKVSDMRKQFNDDVRYKKTLDQMLSKLKVLWDKYKNNVLIFSMIEYLVDGINDLHSKVSKNNDLESFFCELKWNCRGNNTWIYPVNTTYNNSNSTNTINKLKPSNHDDFRSLSTIIKYYPWVYKYDSSGNLEVTKSEDYYGYKNQYNLSTPIIWCNMGYGFSSSCQIPWKITEKEWVIVWTYQLESEKRIQNLISMGHYNTHPWKSTDILKGQFKVFIPKWTNKVLLNAWLPQWVWSTLAIKFEDTPDTTTWKTEWNEDTGYINTNKAWLYPYSDNDRKKIATEIFVSKKEIILSHPGGWIYWFSAELWNPLSEWGWLYFRQIEGSMIDILSVNVFADPQVFKEYYQTLEFDTEWEPKVFWENYHINYKNNTYIPYATQSQSKLYGQPHQLNWNSNPISE